MIFCTRTLYRSVEVSGGPAPERGRAEREREEGDDENDREVAPGRPVEAGPRRDAREALVGVGEGKRARDGVEYVSHLVARHEKAAQEELREHRRRQELHGLELRVGERAHEEAERHAEERIRN